MSKKDQLIELYNHNNTETKLRGKMSKNDPIRISLKINWESNLPESNLMLYSERLDGELQKVKDVQKLEIVDSRATDLGAKGPIGIDLNTLIITLVASGGALTTVINAIIQWLVSTQQRSVVLEIDGDRLEVTGISSKEQEKLIQVWLNKHSGIILLGK